MWRILGWSCSNPVYYFLVSESCGKSFTFISQYLFLLHISSHFAICNVFSHPPLCYFSSLPSPSPFTLLPFPPLPPLLLSTFFPSPFLPFLSFISFSILEPFPVMLKDYSWVCIQELPLITLRARSIQGARGQIWVCYRQGKHCVYYIVALKPFIFAFPLCFGNHLIMLRSYSCSVLRLCSL